MNVGLTPQQAEWLALVGNYAKQSPVDVNAVMQGSAFQQMYGAQQDQMNRAMSAAARDLAARGVLGTGSTPAADRFGAIGQEAGRSLAAMIPQLINTQLSVNQQTLQNLMQGLTATQGTEGWSLGQERDDSALTGQFRGAPTATRDQWQKTFTEGVRQYDVTQAENRRQFDSNQALSYYKSAKDAEEKALEKHLKESKDTDVESIVKFYDVDEQTATLDARIQQGIKLAFQEYSKLNDKAKEKRLDLLPNMDDTMKMVALYQSNLPLDDRNRRFLELRVKAMYGDPDAQAELKQWRNRQPKAKGFGDQVEQDTSAPTPPTPTSPTTTSASGPK